MTASHSGRTNLWRRLARVGNDDGGRAIIEVVFLAVLLLIPTVYILIGLLRLQGATLAVAQAARDVGRLIETSTTVPSVDRAEAVAQVALQDQNIPTEGMRLGTAPAGEDCGEATAAAFGRAPDVSYQVCVTAVVTLPGVPSVIAGADNTVTGVYTVHFSELREGP